MSAMRRIREELDRLQGSLAEEGGRLQDREAQLSDLAARLDARQKELAALGEQIARERRELEQQREDLQKQADVVARAQELERVIQLREQSLAERERAMRRTLEELKRQGRDLERQRREHRRSLLREHPAIAPPVVERGGSWRGPAVVAVAVLTAVIVYAAIRPTYLVQAAWERTDGGALAVEAVRRGLSDPAVRAAVGLPAGGLPPWLKEGRDTRWSAVRQSGVERVLVEYRAGDPQAAVRELNAWGAASPAAIERVAEAGRAAPRPADEVARLLKQRDELRRRWAAAAPRGTTSASAPASAPSAASVEALLTRLDELVVTWQTAKAEHAAVQTRLAALTTRPTAAAAIPESVRAEAYAADPELVRARRRLKEQQSIVRSLLGNAFAEAPPRFGELRRALDELVAAADTHRRTPPDPEAAAELEAIRDGAARMKERLEAFVARWSAAANAFKEASDPVAEQRKVEALAKDHLAASPAELAAIEQRVQAVGDGGAQLTKRLVVRSSLARVLQRVQTAQQDLTAHLNSVVVASSFRLETAVRAATGAAETVAGRTASIDAGLAERSLVGEKENRQREIDELRRQEQPLAAKVADAADAIVPAEAALREVTRRWIASLQAEEQVAAAERERSRLRDEIMAIDERLVAAREAAARVPPIRFVPASYAPRAINHSVRAAWSLSTAVEVLVAGLLLTSAPTRARFRRVLISIRDRLARSGRQ